MRSHPRLAFVAMVTKTAFAAVAVAGRGPDEIRRDYATTWARLVALDVQPGRGLHAVEASDDVGRARDLMGEMASATLRANPTASAADERSALRSLDVEDPVATCSAALVRVPARRPALQPRLSPRAMVEALRS